MVVGSSFLSFYVRRKGGMLHFRLKVPERLRKVLGVSEIIRSLRTNNQREAGRRAQRLALVIERIFDDIGKGTYKGMDDKEIRRLVTQWMSEALEDDERRRLTRLRMSGGFMYLTAVIDWGTRYVLSWELSNSLESSFCLKALRESLDRYGKPDIFNTDQGSQYTSGEFTDALLESGIRISMDGRGRAFDNIFTERLWRSVKYECIYLNGYETVPELTEGLGKWFRFYNEKRPHSSLGGDRTPHEAYFGKA